MQHKIKIFLKNEKNRAVVLTALIFAALLVYAGTRSVGAGLWSDLWRDFLAPFRSATSTPQTVDGQMSRRERGSPKAADVKSQMSELYKPALDYERAVVEAVKKVSPAVVSITVSKNVPIIERCPYNPFGNLPPQFQQFFGDEDFFFSQPCERGQELREVGSGSGFIISSNGLIVTNKHVVLDKEASYTVFTNDGQKYDAKVLAADPSQDLAVIKIEAGGSTSGVRPSSVEGLTAGGLPTAVLGDSDALELGQTAIAIGNALGEFRNTVSVGVISGLARTVTASGPGIGEETIQGVIQTDAAINPGNSGGPLLNLRGEVVGINTAIASGAENIGFAIPINVAKRAIDSVKRTGEIQAPYLGVRYITVAPELAEKQKLPVDYGAIIRGSQDGPGVIPGTPAERAGLLAEDIILEVNGKKVDAENPLGSVIARFDVGETVTLKVQRGKEVVTIRVTLGKRPTE